MARSKNTSLQSLLKRSLLWLAKITNARRYIFPEIGGTVTALSAAAGVHYLTHSLAKAALAGAIGEVIGFYGVSTVREVRHYYQYHKEAGTRRKWLTAYHSFRGLVVEFGMAEFVDSLFVRPFTLYYGSILVHYNLLLGWFVGKLAADIVFLILSTLGLVMRRRFFASDRH